MDRLLRRIIESETQGDGSLCSREVFKKILKDLDEEWTGTLTRQMKKKRKRDDCQKKVHLEVAEVYSPPRMTNMAEMLGMRSGFA